MPKKKEEVIVKKRKATIRGLHSKPKKSKEIQRFKKYSFAEFLADENKLHFGGISNIELIQSKEKTVEVLIYDTTYSQRYTVLVRGRVFHSGVIPPAEKKVKNAS